METNSNHLLVYDEGWNKEPAFSEEAYILCLSLMQGTGGNTLFGCVRLVLNFRAWIFIFRKFSVS